MIEFDEFVGIDWSGSQGYGRGDDGEFPIQIAVYKSANRELRLEVPQVVHNPRWQQNRWSRKTVADWLVRKIEERCKDSKPALIGLDFAFSFPHADLDCYFPAESIGTVDWSGLLRLFSRSAGDNFDPKPFVSDEFYRRFFQIPRERGEAYSPRCRITERAEYLQDEVPANPFKLIGGDQIGRGTISGIAVLQYLRIRLQDAIHIWPFDGLEPNTSASAVLVEVWPRMLYKLIGVPPNAHAFPKVFELALRECGIGNAHDVPVPLGENSGDALITAAALSRFCGQVDIWRAPGRLAASQFPFEGWIWGAGFTPGDSC